MDSFWRSCAEKIDMFRQAETRQVDVAPSIRRIAKCSMICTNLTSNNTRKHYVRTIDSPAQSQLRKRAPINIKSRSSQFRASIIYNKYEYVTISTAAAHALNSSIIIDACDGALSDHFIVNLFSISNRANLPKIKKKDW